MFPYPSKMVDAQNIRIIHARTGKTIRGSNRFVTDADDGVKAVPDVEFYIESRLGRTPHDLKYLGPEWGSYEGRYYIGWVYSTEFEDQIHHCAARDASGERCTAYPSNIDINNHRGVCGRHKRYFD